MNILTISLLLKAFASFLVIVFLLGLWYYFAIARPTNKEIKNNDEKNHPTEKDIRDWDDVLKLKN